MCQGIAVRPLDASEKQSEILNSVASMLEMLKEKVDRRPVRRLSIKPSDADAASSMELESLKLELKLKTADASFLEQEVARKDAMLEQMIKGGTTIDVVGLFFFKDFQVWRKWSGIISVGRMS